jgi:hypothetical protein
MYLTGDGSPRIKVAGVVVFALAAWLQFFGGYPLAGMLLQIVLALSLALRRRMGQSM